MGRGIVRRFQKYRRVYWADKVLCSAIENFLWPSQRDEKTEYILVRLRRGESSSEPAFTSNPSIKAPRYTSTIIYGLSFIWNTLNATLGERSHLLRNLQFTLYNLKFLEYNFAAGRSMIDQGTQYKDTLSKDRREVYSEVYKKKERNRFKVKGLLTND